jgi:hypothetical protein
MRRYRTADPLLLVGGGSGAVRWDRHIRCEGARDAAAFSVTSSWPPRPRTRASRWCLRRRAIPMSTALVDNAMPASIIRTERYGGA